VSDVGINVVMISQTAPINSSTNVSFTVDNEDMFKTISCLNRLKNEIPSLCVEVDPNNVKIEVGGKEIINTPGVAAGIFRLMADNSIDIKIITTSESKISILIYEKDSQAAELLIKTLIK
jgi:aspartate kinase